MRVFVVTISCTLDDVIVGCYASQRSANRRFVQALANPGIRYCYADFQQTDSTPILVSLVSYNGCKAIKVHRNTDYPE
jgi:hypothetical protein